MACNLVQRRFTKHMNRPQAQNYISAIKTFPADENFRKAITNAMQNEPNRKAEGADELLVEAFRLDS